MFSRCAKKTAASWRMFNWSPIHRDVYHTEFFWMAVGILKHQINPCINQLTIGLTDSFLFVAVRAPGMTMGWNWVWSFKRQLNWSSTAEMSWSLNDSSMKYPSMLCWFGCYCDTFLCLCTTWTPHKEPCTGRGSHDLRTKNSVQVDCLWFIDVYCKHWKPSQLAKMPENARVLFTVRRNQRAFDQPSANQTFYQLVQVIGWMIRQQDEEKRCQEVSASDSLWSKKPAAFQP